jgi:N6-L-threonylcarbamoyladenine synthase
MTDGETLILGIESSCDDTAAAVLRARPGQPVGDVLSNVVFGQDSLHAAFGGVVPEIAARAHAERLDLAVERALAEAGLGPSRVGPSRLGLSRLDAVAVAAGPGLIGGVMAGVMFAKGLAAARDLPLWGVNHLAGHALSPRLTEDIDFPYLLLLVSGGHCQLLAVEGPARFRRLGGTIDDAAGEAFDKVAKLLGLPQPGGPAIERAALSGDPARFAFPRPLLDREGADLSFSGLKTAVRRARDRLVAAQGGLWRRDIADIAASFQAAVAEVLAEKTRRALGLAPGALALAVAGGVAANATIRAAIAAVAGRAGVRFLAPPLRYCTDNGAIVAWAAAERMALPGARPDALDLAPRPRWPLDAAAAPMLGGGRKGAKA